MGSENMPTNIEAMLSGAISALLAPVVRKLAGGEWRQREKRIDQRAETLAAEYEVGRNVAEHEEFDDPIGFTPNNKTTGLDVHGDGRPASTGDDAGDSSAELVELGAMLHARRKCLGHLSIDGQRKERS